MTRRRGFADLVILLACLSLAYAQMDDDSEADWLDPSDMLRYEGGKMSPPKEIKLPKTVEAVDQGQEKATNFVKPQTGDGVNRQTVEKMPSEKILSEESPKKEPPEADFETRLNSCNSGGKEGVYFKQYVRALLRQFPADQEGKGVYRIIAALSEKDFKALERFSNSMEGLEDAHDVLIRMIQDVSRTDRPTFTLLDRIEKKLGFDLGSILQLAVIIFLCTVSVILLLRLRMNLTLSRMFFKVFILMFLVSVPWNWWYLYKLAVAKREAEMLKTVPEECRPHDRSATRNILAWLRSSFTFDEDECTKYHEKMMVDPMWEVPPTQALAVTVTKFFLEPFKHIGVAFSDLMKGLLVEMPVQLWPVVLILFTFFTLFIIIIQSGYRVRLLWNVFGLEPPQAQPQLQVQPAAAVQPIQPLPQSERQMIEEQPRPVPPTTVHQPPPRVEQNREAQEAPTGVRARTEPVDHEPEEEQPPPQPAERPVTVLPRGVDSRSGGPSEGGVSDDEDPEDSRIPLSVPERTPLERGYQDVPLNPAVEPQRVGAPGELSTLLVNPTLDSFVSTPSVTSGGRGSELQGAGDTGDMGLPTSTSHIPERPIGNVSSTDNGPSLETNYEDAASFDVEESDR